MPAGAPNEWLERGLDLGSLIWEVRALTQPSSTELSVPVATTGSSDVLTPLRLTALTASCHS